MSGSKSGSGPDPSSAPESSSAWLLGYTYGMMSALGIGSGSGGGGSSSGSGGGGSSSGSGGGGSDSDSDSDSDSAPVAPPALTPAIPTATVVVRESDGLFGLCAFSYVDDATPIVNAPPKLDTLTCTHTPATGGPVTVPYAMVWFHSPSGGLHLVNGVQMADIAPSADQLALSLSRNDADYNVWVRLRPRAPLYATYSLRATPAEVLYSDALAGDIRHTTNSVERLAGGKLPDGLVAQSNSKMIECRSPVVYFEVAWVESSDDSRVWKRALYQKIRGLSMVLEMCTLRWPPSDPRLEVTLLLRYRAFSSMHRQMGPDDIRFALVVTRQSLFSTIRLHSVSDCARELRKGVQRVTDLGRPCVYRVMMLTPPWMADARHAFTDAERPQLFAGYGNIDASTKDATLLRALAVATTVHAWARDNDERPDADFATIDEAASYVRRASRLELADGKAVGTRVDCLVACYVLGDGEDDADPTKYSLTLVLRCIDARVCAGRLPYIRVDPVPSELLLSTLRKSTENVDVSAQLDKAGVYVVVRSAEELTRLLDTPAVIAQLAKATSKAYALPTPRFETMVCARLSAVVVDASALNDWASYTETVSKIHNALKGIEMHAADSATAILDAKNNPTARLFYVVDYACEFDVAWTNASTSTPVELTRTVTTPPSKTLDPLFPNDLRRTSLPAGSLRARMSVPALPYTAQTARDMAYFSDREIGANEGVGISELLRRVIAVADPKHLFGNLGLGVDVVSRSHVLYTGPVLGREVARVISATPAPTSAVASLAEYVDSIVHKAEARMRVYVGVSLPVLVRRMVMAANRVAYSPMDPASTVLQALDFLRRYPEAAWHALRHWESETQAELSASNGGAPEGCATAVLAVLDMLRQLWESVLEMVVAVRNAGSSLAAVESMSLDACVEWAMAAESSQNRLPTMNGVDPIAMYVRPQLTPTPDISFSDAGPPGAYTSFLGGGGGYRLDGRTPLLAQNSRFTTLGGFTTLGAVLNYRKAVMRYLDCLRPVFDVSVVLADKEGVVLSLLMRALEVDVAAGSPSVVPANFSDYAAAAVASSRARDRHSLMVDYNAVGAVVYATTQSQFARRATHDSLSDMSRLFVHSNYPLLALHKTPVQPMLSASYYTITCVERGAAPAAAPAAALAAEDQVPVCMATVPLARRSIHYAMAWCVTVYCETLATAISVDECKGKGALEGPVGSQRVRLLSVYMAHWRGSAATATALGFNPASIVRPDMVIAPKSDEDTYLLNLSNILSKLFDASPTEVWPFKVDTSIYTTLNHNSKEAFAVMGRYADEERRPAKVPPILWLHMFTTYFAVNAVVFIPVDCPGTWASPSVTSEPSATTLVHMRMKNSLPDGLLKTPTFMLEMHQGQFARPLEIIHTLSDPWRRFKHFTQQEELGLRTSAVYSLASRSPSARRVNTSGVADMLNRICVSDRLDFLPAGGGPYKSAFEQPNLLPTVTRAGTYSGATPIPIDKFMRGAETLHPAPLLPPV